ncbi:hypothetical protein HK105_203726 [Polyrhizophydium stewartii]|uniref:DNA polymerase delta subunit 4 n=1 Tax=Polyrhizophydium stewartii TaxID=2732419 RepID=A0ABR4NAT3_9FUNG
MQTQAQTLLQLPRIRSTPVATLLADRDALDARLRAFDLSSAFGPCVGISRLARWRRAARQRLAPPDDLGVLLASPEAAADPALREALWHNKL